MSKELPFQMAIRELEAKCAELKMLNDADNAALKIAERNCLDHKHAAIQRLIELKKAKSKCAFQASLLERAKVQ